MDAHRFRILAARDRILVAVAVLLDGHEAENYLQQDLSNGSALAKAAADLCAQQPELRMPYIGSALRRALEELM